MGFVPSAEKLTGHCANVVNDDNDDDNDDGDDGEQP